MSARKIKVLVVDDSPLVRRLLTEVISKEPDMEVVAAAPDPYAARDKILALSPDVVTLDIEMPRMDGLQFLGKLMRYHPLPVIVISSLAQSTCDVAVQAMQCGAVEVLAKPSGSNSVGETAQVLPRSIRAAFAARLRKAPAAPAAPPAETPVRREFPPGSLLVIGASTGGTQAIEEVLLHMPENCPPILIAQHIPPVFSASFAGRLNSVCKVEVREARDGDAVVPGRALVAPGNYHMMLRKGDRVAVRDGPKVHYQRPAVDVLFQSVAEVCPPHQVGVLLTGMGSDGAEGMARLRAAGAWTIAQDEATCVVFGMPKAAIDLGAAAQVVPLPRVAGAALSAFGLRTGPKKRVA